MAIKMDPVHWETAWLSVTFKWLFITYLGIYVHGVVYITANLHCVPHCKKSWRKTPPAWPDDAVLKYQGDVILFRHADQVNPTSSDDEDGIFRGHWHSAEFSDNFPTTFRQLSVNFPTNENQKCHNRGSNLNPSGSHSSTLPLRHINLLLKCMSSFIRSVYYEENILLFTVSSFSCLCLFFLLSYCKKKSAHEYGKISPVLIYYCSCKPLGPLAVK